MNLEKLKNDINNNLYPGDHIFNFIHHFSFQITPSIPQDSFGAHVKTSNGDFSYDEFWSEIQYAITIVVYGDKYQKKIDDFVKSKKMSENTASNQLLHLALSHFQTKNNQGKMGEVLLFFMMEKLFNAVRLGSKFQLSLPKDQQKGNDATHLGIVEENGKPYPCIYLGEAKFYQDFSTAINESLKSLAFHRPDKKLKEELKWLRTTDAMHNSFNYITDNLGSYDYRVRQIAFIIYKDNSTLPQDKKDQTDIENHMEQEIKNLLEKQLQKTSSPEQLKNHPENHEIHFVVFLLKNFKKAHQAFHKAFNVDLTTLRTKEEKNDSETN